MDKKLSHINEEGKAVMVNVGAKEITKRSATARTIIDLPEVILNAVVDGEIRGKKGPVFEVARLAGIMGVKRTSDLIPMCHPLSVDGIDIDISMQDKKVNIECTVSCTGKTGVEMEALTGSTVAALTIYDMCKALSHEIVIEKTELVHKSGGKSEYQKA